MPSITYQPPSDSVRRMLIRYCTPYTQILAEYIPQMINSDILDCSFTAKELMNALKRLNISISRSGIYEYIKDNLNPIIASVDDNEQIANSILFGNDKKSRTYYMRPKHHMLKMVKDVAYYREYEFGHTRDIPHYEVFEDFFNDEDMAIIEDLYVQSKWKPRRKHFRWQDDYYYFTDVSDDKRTPIDDNLVTKPSQFKIAFFDAIVPIGNYSSRDLQRYTGIHPGTLKEIFKKSSHIRDARRVFVEADSIWEAKKKVEEPGYAVPIGNKTYMVQLASAIRKREEYEYKDEPAKPRPLPRTKQKQIFLVKKNYSAPMFQSNFLMKSLQRVYYQATGNKVPRKNTVEELLDYIKSIG